MELLPFVGGGESPVQYDVTWGGHDYYVRYRWGTVEVEEDGRPVLDQQVGDAYDGWWTDEETTVYLGLIGEAIQSGTLPALRLPTVEEAPRHPYYRKGPLPLHTVGLRCAEAPHPHGEDCCVRVPARDVANWIARHPEEHRRLTRELPALWKDYVARQSTPRRP